jgi:hypothetical protein
MSRNPVEVAAAVLTLPMLVITEVGASMRTCAGEAAASMRVQRRAETNVKRSGWPPSSDG